MKTFYLPVAWSVWDKVPIKANSIEEAIQYLKDNIDEIPLGTEPEYIDGSYSIEDGRDGSANVEDTIAYLRECYPSSLEGYEVEDVDNPYNIDGEACSTENEDGNISYFQFSHIPKL